MYKSYKSQARCRENIIERTKVARQCWHNAGFISVIRMQFYSNLVFLFIDGKGNTTTWMRSNAEERLV